MTYQDGFKVGDRIRRKDMGLTATIIRETDDMWILSEGYYHMTFGKKRFVNRPSGIPKNDDRWEKVL